MREVRRAGFELRDSDAPWLRAAFLGAGRLAASPPDPAFPEGVDVDLSAGAKSCAMALTHPTPQVGKWAINCESCGAVVVVTAAGRPDDPASVRIACKARPGRV